MNFLPFLVIMDECRPTFTGSLTCGCSFGLEGEKKKLLLALFVSRHAGETFPRSHAEGNLLFCCLFFFRLFLTTQSEGKSNTFQPCVSMKTAPGKAALKSTRWGDVWPTFLTSLLRLFNRLVIISFYCSELDVNVQFFSWCLLTHFPAFCQLSWARAAHHRDCCNNLCSTFFCFFLFYRWTTRASASSWSSPAPPAKNIFASTSRSAITSASARREHSTASTARSHFTSKTSRLDMIYLDPLGC